MHEAKLLDSVFAPMCHHNHLTDTLPMLLNLVILGLLFSVFAKKKLPPLRLGLGLGGVKMLLMFVFTGRLGASVLFGLLFGTLGVFLFDLVDSLDQKPKAAQADPTRLYKSSGAESTPFQWEYIPIAGIVLYMLIGEWGLSTMMASLTG